MSAPLPPGWTAYQTPDGRWYFHNSASNVTQWYPPAPPGGHGPPPPGGFHPPGPHGPPPGMMPPPHMHGPPPYGMPPGPGMPPPGAPGGPPPGGPPHAMPPPQAASSASRPVSGPGPSSHTGFTYQQPMEYKLKEKAFSLSGDSFQVKNTSTNETAFKIKGNALSLRDSKKLLDPSGNAIFQMTESLLTLRGRMQIVDVHSKKPLVTLRKKGFISGFGGGTVQIWRGSTDDGEPWLQVKGDWFKKDFNVTEVATQRCLASVRRKSFNLSNIVLEKDTYVIRVEPGVDNALMVFLVVALDELYRDDGKRTGYGSRISDIAGIF